MVGRWLGRGVRGHWWRAVVGMCGAVGLVVVSVQPGDAGVVPGEVGLEATSGVYFDQVGDSLPGSTSVAMSGDGLRVATGSWNDGAVSVHEWNGTSWSQLGTDIDASSYSTLALSGDGSRLVVGGPYDGAGWVRVFEWDGSRWSQLGADLNGDEAQDKFGQSLTVSVDGDRVTVGAHQGGRSGPPGPGYVRVFEWDGVGWSRLGVDLRGAAGGDQLGWSVAMSDTGNRLVISERPGLPEWTEWPVPGPIIGEVRVFDWNGTTWSQVGQDLAAAGDVAASASGDRIAVGFGGDSEAGLGGRTWVFDLLNASWELVEYDADVPPDRHLVRASSVALSADGTRLAYSGRFPGDDDQGRTVIRDELPEGWVDVGVLDGEFWFSGDQRVGLSADGNRMVTGPNARVFDISATPPPPLASPVPLVPARLLESREGELTVDGVSEGIGRRGAGSVTELVVAGRGGVPVDASAVVLDVVAVRPEGAGYLTVFPCGEERPLASSLNYAAGQVIANTAFSGVGDEGTVCVYTLVATDLVIDVTGFTPALRSGLRPLGPDRVMDTRDGIVVKSYETWDVVDRLPAGSVTELYVTGWPNSVPQAASALMLNVAAVRPDSAGYLTVYSCGSPRPLASSVNFAAGEIVSKSVFTRVSESGRVCFFTSATVDVVADVTGYTPAESGLASLLPARLLESREGEVTVDGVSEGIGRRGAGSVTELVVAGRGGVPVDASAVVLDVVAVRPEGAGYLTVFPCGEERPLASSLNYAAGQVIANTAFSGVGDEGTVCVYTLVATDLVIDVTGQT